MNIHLNLLILFTLLFLTSGCKRLPEAPESLEEITNYLFGHIEDEDPRAREAGLLHL